MTKRPIRIVKGPVKAKPTTPKDAGPSISPWIVFAFGVLVGVVLTSTTAHGAVPSDAPRCWALYTNQEREDQLPAFKWKGACERWRFAAIMATCEKEAKDSERQAQCYEFAPRGAECRVVACSTTTQQQGM